MIDLETLDLAQLQANAGAAARMLRTLANERRLLILCQLTDEEKSVGQLQPMVGLSQSALSQHLAVLREDGVVATRREGQTIWYRIADPAALKVVATLAEIFCPQTQGQAMTASLTSLPADQVAERLKRGEVLLIDIREADEFARRRAQGAQSYPLSGLQGAHLPTDPAKDVVFTCRSGMRTTANCAQLIAAAGPQAYTLEGGLDAWMAAGLPVHEDRKAPLELMRQMQIAAGSLVLVGVILGLFVHTGFFAISAFVGAGLIFAGVSGLCGMVQLLKLAPWNRALRT